MRTMVPLALTVALALGACRPGQDRHGQAHRALARKAQRAAATVQMPPATYQIDDIDRLRIELAWPGPGGLRAPRVDVTTPSGLLYTQLPVDTQLDSSTGGVATAVLEVRGTSIDGYHMVGTWVFALVDGSGPPLSRISIDLR